MNIILTAVLLLAQVQAQTQAQGQTAPEWPTFRGPTQNGVAAADAAPPLEWSETSNVVWKSEIPGRGRSSPVVMGSRLFVTFAKEKGVQRKKIGGDDMQTAEHVTLGAACVDRDSGKILWELTLKDVDNPDPVHFLNSWATPTPAVVPGRLFVDFGGWGTWCLDPETGKTLWEKVIPLDHQVGPGSSLTLHKNLLIFIRDGRDSQYVLALDQATGNQVWKTDRPPVKIGHPNMKKSFSTAIEIQSEGKHQLVAVGPHYVVSYDPDTGAELWRLHHGEGFSIGTVPVFGDGLLYAGTGCFKPNMLAIKVDGSGELSPSSLAWRSAKSVPVMSSPLLVGKLLYWNSDEGIAQCAEAATGTLKWQSRLGEGSLASPISAAGRVYFFGKEGKTIVARPGETFEKLAENKLDGTVIATPAFVGKAIYLRTDTHLYRLEAK